MAYKTLQNPGLYGMGNDYEQDLKYVVTEKDGKTTWRDGIYTKLAYDIKDPEGYNKRTVNVPQDKWGEAPSGLSGETDGSALFTSGYATAVSFGQPFSGTNDVTKEIFDAKAEDAYYTSADEVKVPQGIDVAPFRDVLSQDELKKAETENA
jgi:streptogramin lyase